MTTHDLETWPADFAAIAAGTKTHEARDGSDRDFSVGDTLRLREWTPDDAGACDWQATGRALPGTYSGRSLDVSVTHVTRGQYGLPRNLVIMSIAKAKDPT